MSFWRIQPRFSHVLATFWPPGHHASGRRKVGAEVEAEVAEVVEVVEGAEVEVEMEQLRSTLKR